jgi:hypothetical protein
MNLNKTFENSGTIEGEKIIEKLNLKVGRKLKIIKIITSYGSRFEAGTELEGELKSDVKIGLPIEFRDNSNTSNVRNIREDKGKYLIQTVTSTYEIVNNVTEKESKKITDFESFETENGSIYTILPDGRTQRFKTKDSKLNEPQDLIAFVKFTDEFQEQRFLKGVQRQEESGTKVYIVDTLGNKMNFNKEMEGKKIVFVLVDIKTNSIIEKTEAINLPQVGYNTFDQRRFDKEGEQFREKHIGNAIISVKEKVKNNKNDETEKKESKIDLANDEKADVKIEIKNNEVFLNSIERSFFQDAVDSFSALRNELHNRYSNGMTQFFFESDLREFDSLSMKFKDANILENIKESVKYLPLVIDNMANAGKRVEEIKDSSESLGKFIFLIKNLCEKFRGFAVVLEKQNNLENETKKEIIQNLFISADNAEMLLQKISRYRV